MNQDLPESSEKNETSIQSRIEAVMKRFGSEGRWECIFLFSSEGFPMAKSGQSDSYDEEKLLEFAFSLVSTVKILGSHPPVKEVSIRGEGHQSLVFRYFEAWGESMILAAVVSGKRGYRRALQETIKRIQFVTR